MNDSTPAQSQEDLVESLRILVDRKTAALREALGEVRALHNSLNQVAIRLESSEDSLRSLLDGINASVCLVDDKGFIVETNTEWNAFSYVNDGQPQHTGVGVNYFDVCKNALPPGDRQAAEVAMALENIISGSRESYVGRYPCHSPNEKRWFEVCASPIQGAFNARAMVIHANITALVEAERQMEHMMTEFEFLSLLAKHIHASVAFTDSQGRIEWVNEGFTRTTGYAAHEVLGKPAWFLSQGPKGALGVTATHDVRTKLAKQEHFRVESLQQTKSGDSYWGSLEVIPLISPRNQNTKFIAIETVVTP